MTRPVRALAALLLSLAFLPRSGAAQGTGTVAGRAVDAADNAPLPVSIVRLLPADAAAGGTAALTDQAGAFRFAGVAPGRYRLVLERIGYTAPPGAPFDVRAGETVERTLASRLTPVQVEGITAVANACYTADRLDQAPDLAALWREAAKGAEQRRSFRLQYAYRMNLRFRGVARLNLLRDRQIDRDTVIYTHPDSVRRREEEARRARGYGRESGRSVSVTVPDDGEILADDFLRTHCLYGDTTATDDGSLALRFRPVRPRRGLIELSGELWIDPRSYQVRRIIYDYQQGGREWAHASIVFEPVATPSGTVRLPTRGRFRGDPGGALGLLLDDFSGAVEISRYRDFVRVGGG
ncbi:MAG TPA: carboxypeptidase-like regulatory domain-containing protein [Longimicrobium sp.]|nr:carboxypeptidase-like regulatory domain-containing protein [Longimicrobium sp.]